MSDWKIDEQGRRYRIGAFGEKEFVMKVQTSNGTFYEDELPTAQKLQEQREERLREADKKLHTIKSCPFKRSKGGRNAECTKDCVFFGDKCKFIGSEVQPNTINRFCPIAGGFCNTACILYENGCKFKA